MSGSPRDKNNSASTQQIYTSPQRRRHQHTYRRSPGGDPDPSNSEWNSASMASGISSVSRRQRGVGTYNPKMNRKIFLPKLMDDSSEEACWMWRADTLDLIEKGCSEETIEVEMRKSLAICSRGLNDMKRSSPGKVGIQCDTLLRAFYGLYQKKGDPVRTYSMHLDSVANKVCIRFLGDWEIVMQPSRN